MKKKLRRTVAAALSVLMVAGVVLPVQAGARPVPEDALAYGFGQQLDLRLLAEAGLLTNAAGERTGLGVVELQGAQQAWINIDNNDQDAVPQNISIGVLEGLYIDLPGLRIPLIGDNSLLGDSTLLSNNLGLLREYANAPHATEATGAAGLITNDGSLDLHANPGDGGNISLELTRLLKLDPLIQPILDKAALELGALSASAQKPDFFLAESKLCSAGGNKLVEYSQLDNSSIGEDPGGNYGILDPEDLTADDGKFCSGYQIADAIVVIDSPLLDALVDGSDGTEGIPATPGIKHLLNGLGDTVNNTVGSEGFLSQVLGLVNLVGDLIGTEITVTADVPISSILDTLWDEPLRDEEGLVSIDLAEGEIILDLQKLHQGGLNNLNPNTPLVSDTELSKITDTVHSLLTASKEENSYGLTARLDEILRGEGGLLATELDIVLELLGGGIELTTTLGGLLNSDVEPTYDESTYRDSPFDYYYRVNTGGLGGALGRGLLEPIIIPVLGAVGTVLKNVLFGTNGGLLSGLIGDVQNQVISPLLTSLNPLLEGVVRPLADVIVNRQKVESLDQGNLFTISALEVNLARSLLGELAVATLPLATASVLAQSFDPASLELGKFVQNEDDVPVPEDYTLNYVCTHEEFEQAYEDRETGSDPAVSVLDRLSGKVVLQHNTTETVEGLPADASCVITETAPDTDPTSKWTGEWTTDRDWEAGDLTDESPDPVLLVAEETMFIAAVNSYETAFIDLGINVAKLGTGRNLHSGGYQYNVVCRVDGDPVEGTGGSITYPDAAVGEYFTFDNGEFFLREATGPALGPIPVLPGSECTITTSAGISANRALRPTGDNTDKNREPYTYFLYTDENEANVADALNENTVSVDATDQKVSVAADKVGGGWKTHAYIFTVPEDADSHSVNIVHAYDIDERDVVVTKKVLGEDPEDEVFDFRHLTDGADWTEVKNVADEGQFTIRVPVLDENLDPYELTVQEILEPTSVTPVSGPVVSWELDRTPHDHEYRDVEDNWYSETIVGITPVTDAAVLETPPLALDVTNSYAEIEVDKHIEGLLDGVGKTTLHPFGEDKMTISYTVENIGAVDLDTIRIYDPSLVNSLFDLPEHIRVDSSTGEVNGCVLAFNDDGVASCSFEVSFADPDVPFHYEADTAEVTAEATTVIEGREIKATATDKHGAMRLSDLVGMLPATGVTTLVWVMALGLIAALTALALYVRSRRK